MDDEDTLDDIPEEARSYLPAQYVRIGELPDLDDRLARARALAAAQQREHPEWAWKALLGMEAGIAPNTTVDAAMSPENLLQLVKVFEENGIGRPRGSDESGEFEVPPVERRDR